MLPLVVPTVTLLSVPEELVMVAVLVKVVFLMVPASFVAPVNAVVPPVVSMVPLMVMPPVALRLTVPADIVPTV